MNGSVKTAQARGPRHISIPQAPGKPVPFEVVSATGAAARSIPDFNPVKTGHGANRFYLGPAPWLGRGRSASSGGKDAPRIAHQPEWRNVDAGGQQIAVGPGFDPGRNRVFFTIAQPEAGEHVKKPAAIETDNGLDGAIQAGVGAAGNVRPVLAMRTVEMVCPAHVLEIQFCEPPGNT